MATGTNGMSELPEQENRLTVRDPNRESEGFRQISNE